jgi:hypothetical protein
MHVCSSPRCGIRYVEINSTKTEAIRHSAAESVFTPFREDMHASASSARLSILADLAMESLFILRMNRLMHAGGPASVASVGLCRAKIILTVRL